MRASISPVPVYASATGSSWPVAEHYLVWKNVIVKDRKIHIKTGHAVSRHPFLFLRSLPERDSGISLRYPR